MVNNALDKELKSKFENIPTEMMYKLYDKVSNLCKRFEKEDSSRDYINRVYDAVIGAYIFIDSVKCGKVYTIDEARNILKGILYKSKELLSDYSKVCTDDFNTIEFIINGADDVYDSYSVEDYVLSLTSIVMYLLVVIDGGYNIVHDLNKYKKYEGLSELKTVAALTTEELVKLNSTLLGKNLKLSELEEIKRLLEYDIYSDMDYGKEFHELGLCNYIKAIEDGDWIGLPSSSSEGPKQVISRKALRIVLISINGYVK